MKIHAAQPQDVIRFEELLVYFSKSILNQKTEQDVLWDLAKNYIAKLGFEDCVIYLIDQRDKVLRQVAAYGPKNPKNKEIYQPVTIPIGEGISGTVAVTGKSEIIADTTKDPRYIIDDAKRNSEICVPILIDSKVYGIIDCEHREKDFFTLQHVRILSATAAFCGTKIQSIRNEENVRDAREKTLRIKEELLRLKVKAFRAQMNPHFIFNALNAIQYFITSEKKKKALNYLSVFGKLMRFYLKQMDSDTVPLSSEIAMLDHYLKLQKLRYIDKFNYSLYNETTKYEANATIPSFILQTLFENIIEHAIYNQYENYSITAHFKSTSQQVSVSVMFDYLAKEDSKFKYVPDYRQQLLKWQNQIRLLNSLKGYNIKKNVIFTKTPEKHGGKISILLPNLT